VRNHPILEACFLPLNWQPNSSWSRQLNIAVSTRQWRKSQGCIICLAQVPFHVRELCKCAALRQVSLNYWLSHADSLFGADDNPLGL